MKKLNLEQQRLIEKKKFKDDIIDGFREHIIDVQDVMCERDLFIFEYKKDY